MLPSHKPDHSPSNNMYVCTCTFFFWSFECFLLFFFLSFSSSSALTSTSLFFLIWDAAWAIIKHQPRPHRNHTHTHKHTHSHKHTQTNVQNMQQEFQFLKRFQKIPPERVEERDSVQKRKKNRLLRLLFSSLCHWLLKEPYPERRRYREREMDGDTIFTRHKWTTEGEKERGRGVEEGSWGGYYGNHVLSSAIPKRSYLNHVRVATTSICVSVNICICVAPH